MPLNGSRVECFVSLVSPPIESAVVRECTIDDASCALSFADAPRAPNQVRLPGFVPVELSTSHETGKAFDAHVLAVFAAVLGRHCGESSYGLRVAFVDDDLCSSGILSVVSEPECSIAHFAARMSEALELAESHDDVGASDLSSLSASIVFGSLTALQSDLALVVSREEPQPTLALHYDRSVFQASTIARFVESLQRASAIFWEHPELPLGDFPLLSDEQAQRQLASWSGPLAESADRALHRYVVDQALRTPSATAVSFRDRHLTYGELERRSRRLALLLQGQGVARGARVAVCLEPSLDTVICLLGVLRAGATYVPLDPGYPIERLRLMLADTGAEVLLTQRALASALPPVKHRLCVEELDDPFEPGLLDDAVDLEQVAYVIYTSGTTGTPKGVAVSHRNLCHYVTSARRKYGFRGSDAMPAMARSTFSITMFEMFSMLVVGGRLVVLERDHVLDFRRLAETLREVSVWHASPSLLRRFCAFVREHGIVSSRFDNLRHVSSGGDMVSADLVEQLKSVFLRAELFVIYGCSEISCMGCTYEVPREQVMTRSMVGRPFENVAVRLYDARRQLVPNGVVGEIYFGGAGIAQGYFGKEDLTRDRFVEIDGQRFYRTGDLGRSDERGQIEILGRGDFQLKLRGIRVEPGEVEATLRSVPGVKEAVVAAKELEAGDSSLVAYVVLDPRQAPHVRHLREVCRAKLPDYMVPTVFVRLAKLPVNLNQKIDRRALPAPRAEDFEALRDFVPPRTPVESRLVEIWQRVLGTERAIGIRDEFFEVGGNSLMSLTLMMEIERVFGKVLPLSTLLTEPTIEDLALLLEQPADAERQPLVLLRDGGKEPPLFLVHDGEGETLPYLGLAKSLRGERKIYGIQPRSTIDHPMLHSRLSEVVEYYLGVVRKAQPTGPYYLGGLCIGGFIALEVARRLQEEGETVALVLLLDAAHVHAAPRAIGKKRLARFTSALSGQAADDRRSWLERSRALVQTAYRKTSNVVSYEFRSRMTRVENDGRMRLFRSYLDQGRAMPGYLKGIPVQVVLRFAEREFVAKAPYRGEVMLVRATQRSPTLDGTAIDDTPYVENFASPLLGWEGQVESLKVFDAAGGHSSMLQSPNVEALALLVQGRLDARAQELAQVNQPKCEARESIVA